MNNPKRLGGADELNKRLLQLEEAHISPLSRFVRKLRGRMGEEAAIPYVDPQDAGIDAEVLFLLEAPGPKARNSGFVSMDNPDETAKNFFEISNEVGIERKRLVIWNAVPWYIGSGRRIRSANAADIKAGVESLAELLQLLPKLRAIVLVGNKAQRAKDHIRTVLPQLKIFSSPHPSPMFVNRKTENRNSLVNDWCAVKDFLDDVGRNK